MPAHLLPLVTESNACRAAACGFVLLCLATSARAESAGAPAGDSDAQFEFKELDDKSLALSENGKPVFVYNFGDIHLPSRPQTHPHSNYFHPVYGLDGEVLTGDFPADHYHHRGLYWGWPQVQIGDRQFDSWHYRDFRYKFHRWLGKETTGDRARLGVENGWYAGGKHVVKEELWVDAYPATDLGRNIELTLTWTPIEKAITLQGAGEKSYGGLNLRFAPRTNTVITVPDGRASEDLLVTRMPWADLSARIQGAAGPSGAAVFVHPSHPDYPPEWMTRDYGLLAVGWPGVNAKTFPVGESVTCRYRIWIHRGMPEAAEIQRAYDEYRGVEEGETHKQRP